MRIAASDSPAHLRYSHRITTVTEGVKFALILNTGMLLVGLVDQKLQQLVVRHVVLAIESGQSAQAALIAASIM